MANQEHLEILKSGVEAWNAWREENRDVLLDLSYANLTKADLIGAELNEANLGGANLIGAKLSAAHLSQAHLGGAHLGGVILRGANLGAADLTKADLIGAHLGGANLGAASLDGANLSGAYLGGANLSEAYLGGANLMATHLSATNLRAAVLFETVLVDVDLSNTEGLEDCTHQGPSGVDHRTIAKSKDVPLVFWRGCGLPDRLIDNMPSLVGDAIQFYSCFISYSSKDQEFADRLYADLQNAGVRCWFAPHDMRTGDRIRDTIDEQIRVHEKLLLILSESSVSSGWVENEVEAAMEKEEGHKTVLFPVRIDEAVEGDSRAWARTIKRTRHITDFSGWKDHDAYKKSFDRILRDLKPKNGEDG